MAKLRNMGSGNQKEQSCYFSFYPPVLLSFSVFQLLKCNRVKKKEKKKKLIFFPSLPFSSSFLVRVWATSLRPVISFPKALRLRRPRLFISPLMTLSKVGSRFKYEPSGLPAILWLREKRGTGKKKTCQGRGKKSRGCVS